MSAIQESGREEEKVERKRVRAKPEGKEGFR